MLVHEAEPPSLRHGVLCEQLVGLPCQSDAEGNFLALLHKSVHGFRAAPLQPFVAVSQPP